jgi:2-polyprenyl-6-methoxyphenol hydroxylase-like FAD-dependent oxidoreductase
MSGEPETTPAPSPRSWDTRCCVVGGGPAGMMLGYLLAGAAGVNYAIADAVATANHLAVPLRSGTIAIADLQRLQRRREPAVRLAQALQRRQTRQLARLAQTNPPIRLMRLISHTPPIKRLLGRIVGIGSRREHIRSPNHANHR